MPMRQLPLSTPLSEKVSDEFTRAQGPEAVRAEVFAVLASIQGRGLMLMEDSNNLPLRQIMHALTTLIQGGSGMKHAAAHSLRQALGELM